MAAAPDALSGFAAAVVALEWLNYLRCLAGPVALLVAARFPAAVLDAPEDRAAAHSAIYAIALYLEPECAIVRCGSDQR